MYLTAAHKHLIQQFAIYYPLPATDEASRTWTHQLCEQLAYSFPADGWCHKSAGEGRPHSADCIAWVDPFIGWDIIGASGTPQAVLTLDGASIDLTGQVRERVVPTNHLAPEPPDPPEPPQPPVDDCPCAVELAAVNVTLQDIAATLKAALAKLRF